MGSCVSSEDSYFLVKFGLRKGLCVPALSEMHCSGLGADPGTLFGRVAAELSCLRALFLLSAEGTSFSSHPGIL